MSFNFDIIALPLVLAVSPLLSVRAGPGEVFCQPVEVDLVLRLEGIVTDSVGLAMVKAAQAHHPDVARLDRCGAVCPLPYVVSLYLADAAAVHMDDALVTTNPLNMRGAADATIILGLWLLAARREGHAAYIRPAVSFGK